MNVPEQSCQTSTYIYDDEGFWIIYPIFPNSNKIASLTVNYSVMNKNYLYDTEDYDDELWNCLNINQIGSRCFKKNGLFYRIDRFEDGLEIFYIDIDNNNFYMANEIIRSVSKLAKSEKDIPLNKNKRKIIDETRK
ncbi:MAG: hypothetical protein K2G85_08505 [Muribaculaceae bacterium]|nr:hypothetical protein [Muribaculaceae bacterium]